MLNGGNMKNLRFDVKCAKCNTLMDFDDRDFNFIGNFDNYYICPKCGIGCIMTVRYNRPIKLDYYSEDPEFEEHIDENNIHKYVNDKLQGSEFE